MTLDFEQPTLDAGRNGITAQQLNSLNRVYLQIFENIEYLRRKENYLALQNGDQWLASPIFIRQEINGFPSLYIYFLDGQSITKLNTNLDINIIPISASIGSAARKIVSRDLLVRSTQRPASVMLYSPFVELNPQLGSLQEDNIPIDEYKAFVKLYVQNTLGIYLQ
jgi:hypothetical protein